MRFKVGQKVRVVKPYSKIDFYDGEIVEITGISSDAYHGQSYYRAVSCENKEKGWLCLCEDEVDPIPNGNNATPMTNGDKIRAMSNRELAAFLLDQPYNNSACHVCPHKDVRCFDIEDACVDGIEAWLNSEAQDNGND